MNTETLPMHGTSQPDPVSHPEFYADIPTKRLIAWIVDVLLITALTFVVTLLSLFTALFVLPFVFGAIGFLYRWISLSGQSATPGMRLVSIEFLRPDGDRFDGGTAFLHTVGYYVSMIVAPLQLVSIALILLTERRQSLTDIVLGTVAINRRAA